MKLLKSMVKFFHNRMVEKQIAKAVKAAALVDSLGVECDDTMTDCFLEEMQEEVNQKISIIIFHLKTKRMH